MLVLGLRGMGSWRVGVEGWVGGRWVSRARVLVGRAVAKAVGGWEEVRGCGDTLTSTYVYTLPYLTNLTTYNTNLPNQRSEGVCF